MTRRTRRWVVAGLAVVVVAAVETQLVSTVFAARTDASKTRATLASTNVALAKVTTTAAAQRSKLSNLTRVNAKRKTEQANAHAARAQAEKELVGKNHELAGAQWMAALGGNRVSVLRDCAIGARGALVAVEAKDANAASQALGGALASCTTVLEAAGEDPPVFPFDFADPFVLQVGGSYYAYSTNAAGGNIQVLHSNDLTHWTPEGDGLPRVAVWAVSGATWAPEVLARPGGRYVLYYTVRDAATFDECISVATALAPTGPFVDASTAPLVCQHDLGGSIDPSPFGDGLGHIWLLWKSERAPGGGGSAIWSQPLDPSGLARTGAPTVVLRADRGWEDGVVEAPALVNTTTGLSLVFSGNHWDTANYAEGAAHCATPVGPCVSAPGPLLTSNGKVEGPGGASFFTAASGQRWIAYSAYRPTRIGFPAPRLLHLSRVSLNGAGLSLTGR